MSQNIICILYKRKTMPAMAEVRGWEGVRFWEAWFSSQYPTDNNPTSYGQRRHADVGLMYRMTSGQLWEPTSQDVGIWGQPDVISSTSPTLAHVAVGSMTLARCHRPTLTLSSSGDAGNISEQSGHVLFMSIRMIEMIICYHIRYIWQRFTITLRKDACLSTDNCLN